MLNILKDVSFLLENHESAMVCFMVFNFIVFQFIQISCDFLVKPIDKLIDKVALKIKAKIKGESDVR